MLTSFILDEKKATEAAAYLLRSAGGRMKYLRLIKMLYFADRESLRRYGRPIVGDKYVAMHHGPVLSQLYDVIKLSPEDAAESHPVWASHIRKDGYFLELVREPKAELLSEADTKILDMIIAECSGKDEWTVRDLSHQWCPEWSDPGATSRPIPLLDLLRALKLTREQMIEVNRETLERQIIDEIFSR